jgi:hypothetical protein
MPACGRSPSATLGEIVSATSLLTRFSIFNPFHCRPDTMYFVKRKFRIQKAFPCGDGMVKIFRNVVEANLVVKQFDETMRAWPALS